VEDAKGQPPTIPFWLGEAPASTAELSVAVSRLRQESLSQGDGRLTGRGVGSGWKASWACLPRRRRRSRTT